MKAISFALIAAFMISSAAPSIAAPCKDPKTGKFIKCADKPVKKQVCKDAKGKFAKCGSPGAKPI